MIFLLCLFLAQFFYNFIIWRRLLKTHKQHFTTKFCNFCDIDTFPFVRRSWSQRKTLIKINVPSHLFGMIKILFLLDGIILTCFFFLQPLNVHGKVEYVITRETRKSTLNTLTSVIFFPCSDLLWRHVCSLIFFSFFLRFLHRSSLTRH